VITCRIAAREYIFQQFTEVEMADFDNSQIRSFADKWFKTKENNPKSTTGEMFWQALEERKPVKELAANPLLLTLLCLEFDNSSAFPQSRSELYERALNVLLSKWDGQRRIKRDEVYKGLSLKRKETLLGQLAMYTFERGDYFFKEKVATPQIEQYIRNLPGASEDPEVLLVDSRDVLKSMESQHGLLAERATGIYSFLHITIHEYFTAKNILDLSNPALQESALYKLIEHIGEKRWREVFLLVVEGLDNADYLLQMMKHRIDSVMENDLKLQQFLNWIDSKSESVLVKSTYPIHSIRAYYFEQGCDTHSIIFLSDTLNRELRVDLMRAVEFDFARELELDSILLRVLSLAKAKNLMIDLVFDKALNVLKPARKYQGSKLSRELMDLRISLSSVPVKRNEEFCKWFENEGQSWMADFQNSIKTYRNIGHDWQFTDEQKAKLEEYYDANLLLANCLNSECYVSREVREEIEATMLLPVAEIEKWKAENGRN
jgi:predicted NACHT family NTPase